LGEGRWRAFSWGTRTVDGRCTRNPVSNAGKTWMPFGRRRCFGRSEPGSSAVAPGPAWRRAAGKKLVTGKDGPRRYVGATRGQDFSVLLGPRDTPGWRRGVVSRGLSSDGPALGGRRRRGSGTLLGWRGSATTYVQVADHRQLGVGPSLREFLLAANADDHAHPGLRSGGPIMFPMRAWPPPVTDRLLAREKRRNRSVEKSAHRQLPSYLILPGVVGKKGPAPGFRPSWPGRDH